MNVAQELRAILEPDATVLKILCRARGHAFVKLGSAADASAVLSKEYTLGGRRLTVAPTESKQLNLDDEQEPTLPAFSSFSQEEMPQLDVKDMPWFSTDKMRPDSGCPLSTKEKKLPKHELCVLPCAAAGRTASKRARLSTLG